MNIENSIKLFDRANKVTPGGVNSPVRAFKSVGTNPLFIKKGKGSHIWDEDGNEFIDFCCSWGPLIHGHAPESVIKTIVDVASEGTSFGTPNYLEVELAEQIVSNHNYIEQIRFVSSGTEAVMSAIRLARGVTKRDKIIKFSGCYHGHADHLLVKAGSGLATFGTSSSAGVPEAFANETIVLPLNDINALKDAFETYKDQIACIIVEPIPANNGLLLQEKSYLEFLRTITKENNSLLIFDEVISGFRIGFEGAAGYYNIQPDIMTYGKIIGGGLPVGAYASTTEIMNNISPNGDVYQAGTLSGNPVAMAAGIAQLKLCLKDDFYSDLEDKTKRLKDGIQNHATQKSYPVTIPQIGSILWFAFEKDADIKSDDQIDPKSMGYFKQLHQYLLSEGIYFAPSGYEVTFVSSAHSDEDIDKTISAVNSGLDKIFGA